MLVRYGQAVHIREGEPAEEAPLNEVDGDVFRCDLPLMDEAAAVDALATLSDHNVLGLTVPLDDEGTLSWVEYHLCDHAVGSVVDETGLLIDSRSGCTVVDRNEGPA